MSKSNYRLKLTPKARDDLDKIYSYISNELYAEEAANNLLEKIEASTMRLKDFPFSCSYVDDDFLRSKGYCKLIIDNYIAFYVVDEEEKQVVVIGFYMAGGNTKAYYNLTTGCFVVAKKWQGGLN